MKEIFSVVTAICASGLICTLLSTFVTDGGTKKIINLVFGAFIVCSLIVPIKNAIACAKLDIADSDSEQSIVASSDEAVRNQVIKQTQTNLENTAADLLLQNGIKINSCKIILAESKGNSIIISSLCIYINKEDLHLSDSINSVIEQNFGISANIITE